MSKQRNFFILPDDLPTIYDFFNSNDIKYINGYIKSEDDIVLHDFPFTHGNLYDRIYLTSEQFVDRLYYKFNEERNDYGLDSQKSYILEFNPGGFFPSNDRVLHRARFYCKTDYYVSNDDIVVKSDEFKAWVDKIFRLFKKMFLVKTDYDNSIFFTQKTLDWMKENNGQIDKPFLTITI